MLVKARYPKSGIQNAELYAAMTDSVCNYQGANQKHAYSLPQLLLCSTPYEVCEAWSSLSSSVPRELSRARRHSRVYRSSSIYIRRYMSSMSSTEISVLSGMAICRTLIMLEKLPKDKALG